MGRLDQKVAIVTGAAQGIGFGIAKALADAGARVVLSDRNAEACEQAAWQLEDQGACCMFVHADVRSESEIAHLVARAVESFGRLDIVVNNAGVCVVRPTEECTVEDWDDVMAINVRSIFLTTKHAAPHLRQAGGGVILNIGSVSSFAGQQATPAYSASKGAVLLLTKSLALDYGPDCIRVNCLCPGITDTPMLRYHVGGSDDPEALLQRRLARVPLAKMLFPEDMGRAAVFLCSDDARGITGTSLVVDGGYLSCAEFEAPA